MANKEKYALFLNAIDTCFKKRNTLFPEFSDIDPSKLRRIGIDDETIALFLTVPVEDVQACIDLDKEEIQLINDAAEKSGLFIPSKRLSLRLSRKIPDGEL